MFAANHKLFCEETFSAVKPYRQSVFIYLTLMVDWLAIKLVRVITTLLQISIQHNRQSQQNLYIIHVVLPPKP